jgi:hypothetical protein
MHIQINKKYVDGKHFKNAGDNQLRGVREVQYIKNIPYLFILTVS